MKAAIISSTLALLTITGIIIKSNDKLNYFYKDYIKSLGYDLEEHKIRTED